MHFVPNTGWVAGRDRGRIERTDDGGVTWRTLWSARRIVLRSIAVSGRVIVAAGYRALPMRCCPAYEPLGQGLVVGSRDGGRTWRRRDAPTRRGDVEVLRPRTWVMYGRPNDKGYAMRRAVVFRSDDAGRRWRRLALPGGAGFVRFVTPLIGLAGARGVQCPRASQLWRTADGGRTWRAVPGTCGPELVDLEVVSARRLVAAQADGEDVDRPRSVVRRSDDGGASWSVVRRERRRRIVRMAFGDARRALAVHERPRDEWRIIDVRLRATADGGRTWTRRSLPYARYPILSSRTFGAEAPTAFLGPRHAWAGDRAAGIVWRTTDAGRTWRLSAEPESLLPSEPTLSGSRRSVSVWTAAGPATSRDGGRTWAPSRWPSNRAIALAERRNAYRSLRGVTSAQGETYTGPGVVVVVVGVRAFVTVDTGRTWRSLPVARGADFCAVARPTDADVWVTCTSYDEAHPLTVLLTSADRGKTWIRRTTRQPLGQHMAVVSGREAWGDSGVRRADKRMALWHTTDGGATWRQRWVSLRPGAAVTQVVKGR